LILNGVGTQGRGVKSVFLPLHRSEDAGHCELGC
jgi:hypothetical protein